MIRAAPAIAVALALVWNFAGCSGFLPTVTQIEAASPERLEALRENLEERLEKDAEDPELLYLSAAALLSAGELETAEAQALRASSQWRFDGPLTELLGRIYLAQNRRFRALTAFSQAVEFDPGLLSAYVNLAITHQLLGQPEMALEALNEVIGREARYFPAQYHLARILLETDAKELAAETVQVARFIRPDDLDAWLLEARIAKAQGRLSVALFLAREALEFYPGAPEALREILDIHVQRQEWERAEGILLELEEGGGLTPEDAVVKAEVWRALHRTEEVQALLASLAEQYPGHPEVLLARGKMLLITNDPDAAIRVLGRAVESNPRSAMPRYWAALAHFRLGRITQGNAALSHAVQLAPNDPRIRLLRARRLLAEGKTGAAALLLDEHLAEYPADGNALLIKSELLTMRGAYEAAERHLDELVPGENENALLFARVRLAYLRGAFQTVLEQTGAVVERPDAPWQMVYLHAAALGRLERYEEASGLLRGWTSGEKGRVAFFRLAGEIQRLAGNPPEAERIYEQGLGQYPRDPELLERASRLAMDQGKPRKALKWLQTAVELKGPGYSQTLERLSYVHARLGNTEKAREVLAVYLAVTDPLLGERRHVRKKGVLFSSAFPAIGYGVRPPAERP